MKKIKIVILTILMLVSLNTNVLAASHMAASTAAITAAAISSSTARRNRDTYTIDKAIEEIFNETQNEDLRNYILENKQYLYLSSKNKSEEIINKYKESNLEETKQFIKDNYYDENRPKKEKIAITIFAIIIIVILILGVISVSVA